jgi:hypothetical protein
MMELQLLTEVVFKSQVLAHSARIPMFKLDPRAILERKTIPPEVRRHWSISFQQLRQER